MCPIFWTYYGHQGFGLDTFWHKVSKICPNKLEVWTLLGHKQLCWTHFGHELDTFCQKVSKELGLDTSLDTFWTPRAKMCPKSVRPYIVQEHQSHILVDLSKNEKCLLVGFLEICRCSKSPLTITPCIQDHIGFYNATL